MVLHSFLINLYRVLTINAGKEISNLHYKHHLFKGSPDLTRSS